MMRVTLRDPPGRVVAGQRLFLSNPDKISWPIWWLTCLSLICFNLAGGLGPVLLVGFLATWVLYSLAWPARSIDQMLRTVLPWAFPLLALASVLWSQAPANTLRNALELLAVTGFGIVMARAQPARSFVSAFMCMMLTSVLVGTLLGRSSAIGMTNETALIGIFGSKNNFAMMISFMLLSAVAVLPDPRQPRVLRLVALLCCLLAPPYMVLTKSVGAIITLGIALGAFGVFALAARLRGPRLHGDPVAPIGPGQVQPRRRDQHARDRDQFRQIEPAPLARALLHRLAHRPPASSSRAGATSSQLRATRSPTRSQSVSGAPTRIATQPDGPR